MATFPKAMVFVDGSNFLIEMYKQLGAEGLRAEKPFATAFTFSHFAISSNFQAIIPEAHSFVRRYWFGSVQGSEADLDQAAQELREVGFEAVLFRKVKGRDEKGVDLAIAREMLIHAFHKNYETAVLVAGDEDYCGLVTDLKRLGISVYGMFFKSAALSSKLMNTFDRFVPMGLPMGQQPGLVQAIRAEADRRRKEKSNADSTL